jgi:hypothetical protein
MGLVGAIHKRPAAQEPASQWGTASLCFGRLDGFAYGREDGGQVASLSNDMSEAGGVDDNVAMVGQNRCCQGIAVGGAACEDGARA